MNRRITAVLTALVALALVLGGCSSSGSHPASRPKGSDLNDNSGGTFLGAGLDPGQPRPQFTLTDTAGKPFSFGQQTAKQPTMLYFGYTQCPDVCPETMADIRLALSKVSPAVAKQTWVVFVSTDVQHDTGPVIAQWLGTLRGHAPGHWVGLRGTQAEIDAAQAAAHVTVAEDGGQTHSAQTLLYGPDDLAHVTFLESSNEQQQIAHDLPLVAKGTT
ncbi:SCO family protein [uncultured Jatrophihabitans sp.]|uniref:SCO family protein n=1 Tax=uncultured Jatrophihabitans sp. TaxID=1610747 RepID=UPI0035CB06B8